MDAKTVLRQQFFAQRRQLGAVQRERQSTQLCRLLLDWYLGLADVQPVIGKVAMTIQFGTEPDTDPLMHALVGEGVEVWVPISHADRSMSWTRWFPDVALERSGLGPILEPIGQRFGPEVLADADVIVVPALVADSAGFRLGKGGGYYDRLLEVLPSLSVSVPWLVTPVFDHEFVDAQQQVFPVDDHDLPVHGVVTAATGFYWV